MKTKLFVILFVSLFTLPVFGQNYLKRKSFSSDAEYGEYIKDNLNVGMRVKANQDFGDVVDGMTGTYKGDDNGNNPCEILWDDNIGTYNVQYYMVNIIDDAQANLSTNNGKGTGNVTGGNIAFFDVQTKFTSSTYEEYYFEVDNPNIYNEVILTLVGSDYDYDDDGDYTDFSISVNDESIIYIEDLYSEGMGGNGDYSDVSYDITDYLIKGRNVIEIGNTEDDGQVDYTFIKTMIVSTGSNNDYQIDFYDDLVEDVEFFDLDQTFTAQTEETLYFDIDDLNTGTTINLSITGSDYDEDFDGDYTDFGLYVNDIEIFYIETLQSQGLATDGDISTISFDISDYVYEGENEIYIQNTETADQTDYAVIKSISVNKGSSNGSTNKGKGQGYTNNAQLQTIKEHEVNTDFVPETEHDYPFYIDNIDKVDEVYIVITGSDFDADNDGDYTMFSLILNGYEVFTEYELSDKGMATDGNYSDLSINVSDYAKDGLNYFTLRNDEDADQKDHVDIKNLTIKVR